MGQSEEAWNDVGEQLKTLGSMFKDHYQSHEGEVRADVVSDDEVKEALRTLGDSVKTAFASIGDAIADQEIRTEARQTAGSFFDALGATFSELGADISKQRDQESPDQPHSDEPTTTDGAGTE
ncbi:MAG: hypothetical protein M3092_03210 [Actinomycetia bacterium]|nr:hypothetical protein [Actinomycetes bacterium]